MAEKLDMKSMNITEDNVRKIQALFPNVVTEIMGEDGKFKLAIDFDALKQELSNDLINEKQERYQMTWPDKSKAKLLANSRISATLRPDKEKSVNFDTTKNLYIEGDNLDVLKLLRETYLGKIKMIYIDPPYNTGNDFVYDDDFAIDGNEYKGINGDYDEQGNRLVKNLDSNGRFHTDWLNMIYPRLKIARDLLTDDGVIFISIDDNEIENLIKICNEVFGEANRVAVILREAIKGGSISKNIRNVHDYVVCFAKCLDAINFGGVEVEGLELNLEDEHGKYAKGRELNKWGAGSRREDSPSMFYPIPGPNGEDVYPIRNDGSEGRWRLGKVKMFELLRAGNAIFEPRGDGTYIVYEKLRNDAPKIKQYTTWFSQDYINSRGTEELKTLFDKERAIFDFSKPSNLIHDFLVMNNDSDCIVLDFFSGSATTAHAVMQLNAEDGGNRKFIMVQLPEKCEEKSEAYKAGYKTICDIGEERIRRAGRKIIEDLKICGYERKRDGYTLLASGSGGAYSYAKWKNNETGEIVTESRDVQEPKDIYKYYPNELDIGFRVFKLDSSNMNDVYYNPAAFNQSMLDMTVDNVKADRTPLDLLFQVMLDLSVELSADIVEKTVNGKKIYAVNGNDLIACFDNDIDNDVITAIATEKPLYAVFKDKSFATDSVGINNEQLFKTYSPATVVKVL